MPLRSKGNPPYTVNRMSLESAAPDPRGDLAVIEAADVTRTYGEGEAALDVLRRATLPFAAVMASAAPVAPIAVHPDLLHHAMMARAAPLMGLHAAHDRSDGDNGGGGRHKLRLRHVLLQFAFGTLQR